MNIIAVTPQRRAIKRAWPNNTLWHMGREMDQLFNTIWNTDQHNNTLRAPVDVVETDAGLTITMDLPGVSAKSTEIELDDNILTIKALRTNTLDESDDKKKKQEPVAEPKVHLSERAMGTFNRRFQLPIEVDEDNVNAKFDNGVLTITIPRAMDSKSGAKRIPIQ